MEFNDMELRKIKRLMGGFCENRTVDRHRIPTRIWYEIRGYEVKVFEDRQSIPGSDEWTKAPFARLRFDPQKVEWDLYWAGSGRWQKHPNGHAKDLSSVVNELRRNLRGGA
jgi:hypothetical protein